MLKRYYEQELSNLRVLANEFAASNPSIAPMLGNNSAADPDVERLLEGVAFLMGMMRQRLDDDFPEVIQQLAFLLFPQFLQPLPCMTILQYQPRPESLEGTVTVPAGTDVASLPIDGTRVIFTSVFPVAVEPITLHSTQWEGGSGEKHALTLLFSIDGVDPLSWQAKCLRFYLGDTLPSASKLLLLLSRHVSEIRIGAIGEPPTVLQASAIELSGFDSGFTLLPGESNQHPAYRSLREYFAFPEKFLFVSLLGLERWDNRGTSGKFKVSFIFNTLPAWVPEITNKSFLLNATPSINVFEADAQPIRIDHKRASYPVRLLPDVGGRHVANIFDITKVTGLTAQGEVSYRPFSNFEGGSTIYHRQIKPSINGKDFEYHLSVSRVQPPMSSQFGSATVGQADDDITLSVRVRCTHGRLPEMLRLGDLSQPTDTSPARMMFSNIRPITEYRPPVISDKLLWRMLSHLNSNYLRINSRDEFVNMLMLQAPITWEGAVGLSNQRCIESIETFNVVSARRITRGIPIEGSEIMLTCHGSHFASIGVLFLFGSVLDEFFAGTTSLNTYTELTIYDSDNDETLKWPAKIGRLRLL